jgi:coenzyme F420-reducing hydrogenase beta subunit
MMNSSRYVGEYEAIIKCKTKNKVEGTSGGFVTTMLTNLMKAGEIDSAIVVDSRGTESFYIEATTPEQIHQARGSKYQLLSPFPLLNKIDKNKRYAVVLLPCHIAKARKISEKNGSAIKLIIGLFCGFMLDKKAPDMLVKSLGIEKDDVKKLEYRGGNFPGGFRIQTHSGKTVLWPKKYYTLLNKMFAPKGCLKCSHFSAEMADIAVGDAWEEFEFSRVILRNQESLRYFSMVKDHFKIKDSNFDDIYKTQWHLLQFKKRSGAVRRKVLRSKKQRRALNDEDKDALVNLPLYEKMVSYFFIYEILFFRKIREVLLSLSPKFLLWLNTAIRKVDFFLGGRNKKYILEDLKNRKEDEEK